MEKIDPAYELAFRKWMRENHPNGLNMNDFINAADAFESKWKKSQKPVDGVFIMKQSQQRH